MAWPASLIYVFVVYVAAIAALLSLGLGLYMVITGVSNAKGFGKGLLAILIVVALSNAAGLHRSGLLRSAVVAYMATWLPMVVALWLSMRVARPRTG